MRWAEESPLSVRLLSLVIDSFSASGPNRSDCHPRKMMMLLFCLFCCEGKPCFTYLESNYHVFSIFSILAFYNVFSIDKSDF